MSMSYTQYLKVEELTQLQECLSDGPEHDEMLFIVIHQTYELWFKQVLHETDHLMALVAQGELAKGGHTLKRILKIFKTLVTQLDILETMTPLEFLSFRRFLDNSSGFQSYQFRELEFVLGMKSEKTLQGWQPGGQIRERLQKRFDSASLWHGFVCYLDSRGYAIPEDLLNQDLTQATQAHPGLQQVLIDIYRNQPDIAEFCESLTDFDEGLQEWRYRHMKMVERTIGVRMGTGGSAGAAYLMKTLFNPVFPDLWEIRSAF